jgi:hypothetical protein
MGRKQKLRQEKRNIKNKAAAAEVTAAACETTDSTEDAIVEATAEEKARALENQLPKTDMCVQAINMAYTDNINTLEQFELFKRGATEHGCVHSMFRMGKMLTDAQIALPWFLEGAIRGSFFSTMQLMGEVYFPNRKADALQGYWWRITSKYYGSAGLVDEIHFKNLKGLVERECIICSKTDTKTLTLQQCEGCSVYCYCSEGCQTIHWKERKHRNECKQLRILNKYHKPYFKEIRDAVIRGDKEIPSLEKLRYKLGLTRPTEEYQEFFKLTHNGKKIDPDDYLVAREDGTVWVGSTPSSPIGIS